MEDMQYLDRESYEYYSVDELKDAEPEIQISVMRTWFYSNYEDPAENTPYESKEGGYIYIWGGPYDADDVLQAEFYNVIPYEVIQDLVEELNNHCWEWAPVDRGDDYYDYLQIDDIANISEYHENFLAAIESIKDLLEKDIGGDSQECLFRMLYTNVITAVETYLSDAFINTVMPEKQLLRKFVESLPEFSKEKITVSDVYRTIDSIEVRASKFLFNLVWHNFGRVKPLYSDVLGLQFPEDVEVIASAISTRHDLVHRNGKMKDGKNINIGKGNVEELIGAAETFVTHIDNQLEILRSGLKLAAEPDEEEVEACF